MLIHTDLTYCLKHSGCHVFLQPLLPFLIIISFASFIPQAEPLAPFEMFRNLQDQS
jgi:hypothetical protein